MLVKGEEVLSLVSMLCYPYRILSFSRAASDVSSIRVRRTMALCQRLRFRMQHFAVRLNGRETPVDPNQLRPIISDPHLSAQIAGD